MDDIYFKGFWRMDWGLGNPNKTAGLIAILMIAVWGVAYFRRWGFWVALTLFTGLAICLVHTFSRGGFIAAFAGLIPALFLASRHWRVSRIAAVAASVGIIVGISIYLQAYERYSQGIVEVDRSISNRIDIWKAAAVMMVDAPGGWGIGNAGRAYMDWYQPLDRIESYRTLVNSHLTWMVELGWIGRFFYLLIWCFMFLLTFPTTASRWLSIPFGIWICLFISSSFSSVAESLWLWFVPILSMACVILWRLKVQQWPTRKRCGTVFVCYICMFSLLPLCVSTSAVRRDGSIITIGEGQPLAWIVYTREVLGVDAGRALRQFVGGDPKKSYALVYNSKDLPSTSANIIFANNITAVELQQLQQNIPRVIRITLINPILAPKELDIRNSIKLKIMVGEYAQRSPQSWEEHERTVVLNGVGDFVPNWPSKILAEVN